ncbi:phage tail assembly chaperone [Sandaracinobacter sp.]|jgi:hypothetical protein|uniref:phage tail assembly chaperone n=1 Tax=Sandaracinobacter sp. TaxID=2487581 RepID=UPI0035AEDF24
MNRFSDVAVRAAQVATGVLGWSPDQFWQATATELAQALEGRAGPLPTAPLGRSELERLERGVVDAG